MQTKDLLLLLFLLPSAFCQPAFSQDSSGTEKAEKKLSLYSGTIEEQFDFITSKSNSYQEYKVVKKVWLAKIESNISDSLNKMKNELAGMKTAAVTHQKEIDGLQAALASANTNLDEARVTKNNISFIGIPTHKTLYSSLMWGLVLVLGAVLLFFIFKSKRAELITSNAVKDLREIREEFDSHRKKALEREQKLKRKLQDELNKQQR